jgi:alpha-ribazole phosphatase
LILIRHAPALTGGRLCGRTDVPADLSDGARLAALSAALPKPARLAVSPALRCRQTAAALWSGESCADPRLWEQDFGDWDGAAYADVPDLGRMDLAELARVRPPGGESFADLCDRIAPALSEHAAAGPTVIVAHAGTVRAALALALGSVAGALAFDVAPLSVTRIARLSGGWQVRLVNWTPVP